MNASPAPVVSMSSSEGIASAVPKSNLPLMEPTPSALILKFDYRSRQIRKRVNWKTGSMNSNLISWIYKRSTWYHKLSPS